MDSTPSTISRYELKGLIARGGMSRLYLAHDPNTSRLVIVKLLDATLDSTELRNRFDREAQLLASLSHPHIVRIYDYGDFEDSPFIVMEYLRGETLDEKIRRRARMSVGDKLRAMVELCDGLAYAHAAGIIHRDIKPANLMVDQDGRLTILDFGIARVADSNLTRVRTGGSWMQMQIGTPGYMSPEQTLAGEIDARTDIFAVGAVCYELFAYRQAFPGSTAKEIESRVMRTPPAPLASQLPTFDPEIDAILARAMAKDRNQRFPDATALQLAFERCRTQNPSENTALTRRPTPPPIAVGGAAARADAAYVRALGAYDEQAFEVARRFAIEALAEDATHGRARELLARLDPERPPAVVRPARVVSPPPPPVSKPQPPPVPRVNHGPEVVSTDPTILISRANSSRPASAQQTTSQMDATVLIKRKDLAIRSAQTDETVLISSSNQRPRPAPPEPTAITTGKQRQMPPAAPSKPAPTKPSGVQVLWLRMKSIVGRQPAAPNRLPPRKAAAPAPVRRFDLFDLSNPTTRGVVLVLAVFAVAAAVVFGGIRTLRWLRPAGQLLTLTKPVGGTIVGPGLECGTRGSDCSATRPTGEAVELRAIADDKFLFSGWTGDCPGTGRIAMSEPRSCGATFAAADVPPPQATWSLTVNKPIGGSIIGVEIECGTVGSKCSADMPPGVPVTLHARADDGYRLVNFTEDCAPSGEMTMTSARTCGAVFAQVPKQVEVAPPSPPRERKPSTPTVPVAGPQPIASLSPGSSPVEPPKQPSTPAGGGRGEIPAVDQLPIVQPKAPEPITQEKHAQDEIQALIKTYCAEYETLKPQRIKVLFPLLDLRYYTELFKQYKSLRCTTKPPEFDRLDAGAAGAAQVKFEMKQEIQMKVGGAPQVTETIVTMGVTRPNLTSPWHIDYANHVTKPKP